MPEDQPTRDRVRALVKEVLRSALPAEEEGGVAPSPDAADAGSPARARVIPMVSEPAAADDSAFTRDESSKMVITEADVSGLGEGARLRVAEGARLTPLAADIVRERGIELVRRVRRRGSGAIRTVAVGADHGGFKMKEGLKAYLEELGHRVRDYGTDSGEAVDYPDFAHAVARAVAERQADVGIVIDGAGVGSAMTANKVPGVRAAACYSAKVARNSREHNDANVLTLGSQTISAEEMREIVSVWLSTEMTEERHKRRVAKIEAVERQYGR